MQTWMEILAIKPREKFLSALPATAAYRKTVVTICTNGLATFRLQSCLVPSILRPALSRLPMAGSHRMDTLIPSAPAGRHPGGQLAYIACWNLLSSFTYLTCWRYILIAILNW